MKVRKRFPFKKSFATQKISVTLTSENNKQHNHDFINVYVQSLKTAWTQFRHLGFRKIIGLKIR